MAAPVEWRRSLLNSHSFIEQLREAGRRDKHYIESRDILTYRSGELFAWNRDRASILTTNLKSFSSECNSRNQTQTFLCTDPPLFEVECIKFNKTNTSLALIGRRGVSVIQIPKKWGKYAEYEGGKPRISCGTIPIDEHLFASNSKVTVLQASWHPGSTTDSHIVLLTSDNYLRVYNLSESQHAQQTIPLGYHDTSFSLSASRTSFCAVLGGHVVSFDFGSAIELPESEAGNRITWPVFLLRGNGDICLVYTNVTTTSHMKERVLGPLTMYPPADDNYGTDSCSVLCLPTQPPVLVIAECSGKLYHCVVLTGGESDRESEVSWAGTELSSKFSLPDLSLYVYESVELELSLTTASLETDQMEEDDFTSPLRLHHDLSCMERYHCSHGAGVHTVALPWIQKLEQFCDDEHGDMYLLAMQVQEAIVEHVICTKPLPASPCSPVAGLCIASDHLLGKTLLCLTSDMECIALPLMSTYTAETPVLLSDSPSRNVESPLRKIHKEPFDKHIKKMLLRSTSNPLLRSRGDGAVSQQQCFQLLTRATQVFREEYVQKQDMAREEIERRVSILKDRKDQQQTDLQECKELENHLTDKAHALAEKYTAAYDNQQELVNRLETVLRKLQCSMPVLSHAEKNMAKELRNIEEKLKHCQNSFKQAKSKLQYQKKQISEHNKKQEKLAIGTNQTQRLKDVLRDESEQIAELINQVKVMRVQADV